MIKTFFYKVINIVFFTIFSWIFINVLLNNNGNSGFFQFNPAIIIGFVGIFIGMLIYINKVLENRCCNITKKRKTIIVFTLMAVVMIIQLILGYYLRVTPTWDFGFVHRNAVSLVTGNGVANMDYFLEFRNNTGVFLFLSVIYKAAYMLGIERFVAVGIILNVIMIDIAIILMFYICDRIFGTAKAFLALLVAILTTPFYTYAPIYYTDTLSMVFPVLILYLFILSKEITERWKKYILYAVIGVIGAGGGQIKLTVIFMLIAITLQLFLEEKIKEYLPKIIIMVVTFFIATQIFYVMVDSHKMFDFKVSEKSPIPYTHWVMMGMKGHGGWDYDDYLLTYSYSTREERTKANLEEIKNRLDNYGRGGYFKFLTIKASWTWGDGTYYSPSKLKRQPINNGIYQEIFLQKGKYFKYYAYFSQVVHIAILFLILVSAFCNIIIKNCSYTNILRIVVFGLMAFLLMWETRSRYIVNYIPIFILIAMEGIQLLQRSLKQEKLA